MVLLVPSVARAGDVHTDTFAATVTSAVRVESYTFDDRIARFDHEEAPPRTGGPACAVTVTVDHPYFRRPETFYASVAACDRVAAGESITVQYLGLADYFQFVAVKVDGVWAGLPLMRDTAGGTLLERCTAWPDRCAPIAAPAW